MACRVSGIPGANSVILWPQDHSPPSLHTTDSSRMLSPLCFSPFAGQPPHCTQKHLWGRNQPSSEGRASTRQKWGKRRAAQNTEVLLLIKSSQLEASLGMKHFIDLILDGRLPGVVALSRSSGSFWAGFCITKNCAGQAKKASIKFLFILMGFFWESPALSHLALTLSLQPQPQSMDGLVAVPPRRVRWNKTHHEGSPWLCPLLCFPIPSPFPASPRQRRPLALDGRCPTVKPTACGRRLGKAAPALREGGRVPLLLVCPLSHPPHYHQCSLHCLASSSSSTSGCPTHGDAQAWCPLPLWTLMDRTF